MEIAAWLRELGLERYLGAFEANDIDLAILRTLDADDLKELGVTSLGHRKKLMGAIAALDAGSGASEPPDAAAHEPGDAGSDRRGAERRQLTIMFVDLVGSTPLAARLDPEDMGEVLKAYRECCADLVTRWDGHVAKYMGDGVLAYFGWPRAHEDDAERAVRAGLELTQAVGEQTTGDGTRLAARVGVATGRVVVGDLIGEGAAQERAVVGETPNLAARLQGLAEPGGIVIAEATQRLIGGLFELADLGGHELRGFDGPVRAWRVVGGSRAESRFAARSATGLTPFVGRQHELGLLLDRFEQAREGEGQVLLLSGEPGIGKSRLVHGLTEHLAAKPHVRLRFYCSPYHVNSALHPVIEQIERAAGFLADDPPERKLDRLETLLSQSTNEPAAVAPLFAALLSIPHGARYPPLNLPAQRQRELTIAAMVEQVGGLAARRPVLVVLEDAHWIDPTTTELFERLIERSQTLPVLLLITFRPEFAPPWTSYPHMTSLDPEPARAAAQHGDDRGGRGRQAAARGGAGPDLGEDRGRAAVRRGADQDGAGVGAARGPGRPLRADRPAAAARDPGNPPGLADGAPRSPGPGQGGGADRRRDRPRVLLPAPRRALAARRDRLAGGAVASWSSSELVFRRGTASRTQPTASSTPSSRTRPTQSLLRSRRQMLHARIASVLEERFSETIDTEPEVLARHCQIGGLTEQAIDYWQRAGQLAAERSANAEAAAHFHRSLELLEAYPEAVERRQKELDLLTALGSILISTKGHGSDEVATVYTRARDLCRALGETPHLAPVLQGLRLNHMLRAELRPARQAAEQLLALGERVGDAGHLLEGHRAVGILHFFAGEFRPAREHLEKGIAIYEAGQHRSHALRYAMDPGQSCLGHAARTLWMLGYPDQALQRSEQAVILAQATSHVATIVEAMGFRADIASLRRELEDAREWARAAVAFETEHGLQIWLGENTVMHGWAMSEQAPDAAAVAQIRDGLTLLARAGDRLSCHYHRGTSRRGARSDRAMG